MRHGLYLVLLAACSGPAKPAPQTVAAACGGDDMWACYQARRAQCSADTVVWQVTDRISDAFEITYYVSDNGLMRRDVGSRVMYTADASTWLSCVADCPGAGATTCVPYPEPFEFGSVFTDECEFAEPVADAPWNELPSVRYTGTCRGQLPVQARVVPGLQALRDAYVKVGAIAADGGSQPPQGVAVEIEADGHVAASLSVTRADCTAFELPAGAAVHASREDETEARAVLPALEQARDRTQRADNLSRSAEFAREMESQVLAAAGELCLGKRDAPYEKAEVQSCYDDKPELLDELADISRRIAADMSRSMMKSASESDTERTTVDVPLCEHFTR